MTTKILTLLRHAKSSWNHPDLNDFERPLNQRGNENAPMMGQRLAALGFATGLILSSPARRALDTAGIIAEKIDYPVKRIVPEKAIYEAEVSDLISIIHTLNDACSSVMLVGHNPALTELCNHLGDIHLDNLPTCGLVQFVFDVGGWSRIIPGKGRYRFHDYPKNPSPPLHLYPLDLPDNR